jgi:hypothetical protein
MSKRTFMEQEQRELEELGRAEVTARLSALGGAYDEGRLDGMVELANAIISGLLGAGGIPEAGLLRRLAREFDTRIVGCGDVIPEEFASCWDEALDACGATLAAEEGVVP